MRMRGPVEIGPCAAWLRPGCSGSWISINLLHAREIDDNAVITGRVTSHVVGTAANRDQQILVASEVHARQNILRGLTAGDQRRSAVNHPIPDLAGVVVGLVAGNDDRASQLVCECVGSDVEHADKSLPGTVRQASGK